MSAQHTPGPWVATRDFKGAVLRRTYFVARILGDCRREYLLNAGGNPKRFRSRESADAAIAKATGAGS